MNTLTQALHWLSSPLSGASEHLIESAVFWHARWMVLAWAVCLPLGALVARYFKITPRQDWPRVLDSKFWWHSHRVLQYTGILAMSAGAWLVWRTTDAPLWSLTGLHRWLGWLVLLLGWLQMLGGILRGSKGGPTDNPIAGDHYDMSRKRLMFERLHKSLGWLAVALAIAVIVLGLFMADAPRWMLCALLLWWIVLLTAAAYLQARGCNIDTYQAIWGIDPGLPGLQRPPIGWGVRRTQKHPWRSFSTQD
jgi:Eukaryotic cytochrome b561